MSANPSLRCLMESVWGQGQARWPLKSQEPDTASACDAAGRRVPVPELSDWQHRSWEQCVNGVPACPLSTPGPFAAGDKMTVLKVSAQQSRKDPHSAPS